MFYSSNLIDAFLYLNISFNIVSTLVFFCAMIQIVFYARTTSTTIYNNF